MKKIKTKKINEPKLKVVKFKAMDIIATSGGANQSKSSSANTSSITYNNVSSLFN